MDNKAFDEKYAKYYDLFNTGKDYSEEVGFLEAIFKKYGIYVRDILDLGCGTGIHAQTLSLKGYDVLGLDLSPYMIKIADSRKNEKTEFMIGDMSDFELDRKFDVCISMFAAFGYLTKNEQIKSCLNCIKRHVKKGGLFIFDVWNGLGVIRELPSSRTKETESGNFKIKRTSFPNLNSFNHLCGVKFDVKVFENNSLIDSYEENHSMRFFFPQEIKKYLEDAGFDVLEICDTFKIGTEVNENNWNMCVIARLKME